MNTIPNAAVRAAELVLSGHVIDGPPLARACVDLAQPNGQEPNHRPSGLGPNQLTWLRINIPAFKRAQEARQNANRDVLRALRLARLS